MTRSKGIVIVLILGSTFMLLRAFFSHIAIAQTPSVPYTFYWADTSHSIGLDDYVRFPCAHELIDSRVAHCIKQVKCMPGMRLERREDGFYCEGQFIDTFRLKMNNGNDLPQFAYSGEVPKGMAFMYGSGVNSLDSRYLGLFSLEDAMHLDPWF